MPSDDSFPLLGCDSGPPPRAPTDLLMEGDSLGKVGMSMNVRAAALLHDVRRNGKIPAITSFARNLLAIPIILTLRGHFPT
jgi:hypothetical protein